jgi:Tfp pilus assembly protein PilF/peroxiredoxin
VVELPSPQSTARIPMASLLPIANLEYQTLTGEKERLPGGNGRAYVLSLWASWCPPCEEELSELSGRQEEIRAAGIDIIALAVDELGEGSDGKVAAQKLAERLKLTFKTGHATNEIVSYLQTAHDSLITGAQTLPVPVSFLVDANGKLAVIYKGKLKIDALINDLRHSQGTPKGLFARPAPLSGRTLPIPTASRERNQYEARYRFATFLQQKGFTELAKAENLALIESYPGNAAPYNNLGISYIRKKDLQQAEASFREAIRLNPDYARAHANLGTLLAQKGQLTEATGHFQQALAGNPKDRKSLTTLSSLWLKLEQWADAKDMLEALLQLEPKSANTLTNLGLAPARMGDLVSAADQFEKALALKPNHADARRNLTIVRNLLNNGR